MSFEHGRAYASWDSPPHTKCLVEVSDDLQSWRKAALIEVRESPTTWADSEDPLPEKRFYRVWR